MTPRVYLDRPWLTFDFGAPQRVLSWAINQPGFVTSTQIIWREVRNADLPEDLNVDDWLQKELASMRATDAVAFLTSRDVGAFHDVTSEIDGVTARCVATVGLSNAERVGARVDRSRKDWGTINIAVHTNQAISHGAQLEAMAIAAQARTVAVTEAGFALPSGPATGTGTDCIAIAATAGTLRYAGLHTALGEAIGRSVLCAVSQGVAEWMKTVRREED
jgi:adenosylcobinamide amidohydrolase